MSKKNQQLEIAERLQLLLLEQFEELLEKGATEDGGMTPTDRSTLARLLMQNGWSIDPAALPQGIRDKLSPDVLLPDDEDALDDELYGHEA